MWLKQTLYVRYFTKLIWCVFGIGPLFCVYLVIDQWKSRQYVLVILMDSILEHSVIYQWINQKICVRNFTELIRGKFGIGPVIKADTAC